MNKAFVGVNFLGSVVHCCLNEDDEAAILRFIERDRNLFVSKIIESQSYASVQKITDMKFIFSDYFDETNNRVDNISDVYHLMNDDVNYGIEKFYILDVVSRVLTIKTKTNSKQIPIPNKFEKQGVNYEF